MEAVAGCFILAVTYLSCAINPLHIGSYPDVEFITFSGTEAPRILFFYTEDWPNLKFISNGEHVYACYKSGQCLLRDSEAGFEPTSTFKTSSEAVLSGGLTMVGFEPTTTSKSSTEADLSSGLTMVGFDTYVPPDTADLPKTSFVSKSPNENIKKSVRKSLLLSVIVGTTINPSTFAKTQDELSSHSNNLPTMFPIGGLKNKFAKTYGQIKDKIKETIKKELDKQLEKIKELIIGFSTSIISIPFIGGGIMIGVKIYRKRHNNLAIPQHLYLPLHSPPTVGHRIQCQESDSDEDLEVFDIRSHSHSRARGGNLTPTAPPKQQTPQRKETLVKERETVVKEKVSTAQCNVKAQDEASKKPCKIKNKGRRAIKRPYKAKNKGKRSLSEPPIGLRNYNFRPRHKEVQTAEL